MNPELSPSETILLTGERYAKPSSMWAVNLHLLHKDEKVQAAELCFTMLMAALLDGEAKGIFSLNVRRETRKVLFGLMGTSEQATVYATPRQLHHYPQGSLEARLANLLANGEIKVQQLAYTLLGEDTAEPWLLVFNMVVAGLCQRELLIGEKVKHLLWTSTDLKAPASTLAGVQAEESARIDALLANTRQQRAELWQLLTQALQAARSDRVKKDDPTTRSNDD